MVVNIGDKAPDFTLTDVNGDKHTLSDYRGERVLLSFFRYASCALCNFSIDRLKRQNNFLTQGGIKVICVFQSPPEMMKKYVMKQAKPPFIMLCDTKLVAYKKYNVKHSMRGLKWGLWRFKKSGQAKIAIERGLFADPQPVDGKVDRLPADFLIDEEGKVVDKFQAKFANDHIPWKRIEAFIPKEKKCNCKKADCLSAWCKTENAERKKNFAGIFLGNGAFG
uniref:Thioredoxin domain-containing protein n=1 Tax=Pseudictyota dubia TaxID=2749911 RepID=A0A7R9VL21_9STRA|mmetsp:Transcript_16027/g.30279  ORF Transcript_16027/g.30279 Transcript_16027/m.30279 type:complete len:222 (+) Transcript_16027:190-855(+)|eukprot:CAMPEP_0197445834 /NCGR_PEP_ID=MMETSP1175-20131217/10950_1 /TAXON_ID=1003142 /ORGANISM="Triceratium dubium, Strain CCMP147" /LENGTH=221 /DNA_ID=CAMNT_0042976855 /DNA_START=185 /DNA_END=850 /DNA_ORIENTATION=+